MFCLTICILLFCPQLSQQENYQKEDLDLYIPKSLRYKAGKIVQHNFRVLSKFYRITPIDTRLLEAGFGYVTEKGYSGSTHDDKKTSLAKNYDLLKTDYDALTDLL